MTLRSMTGYGSAAVDTPGFQASATVRSLNHRYLDLSVRLSRSVATLEPEVKDIVQGAVGRGKVDVSLQATFTEALAPVRVVAQPYVAELVKTLRGLREQHGLGGDVTLSDVARFGAVEVVEAPAEFSAEQRDSLLGVLRQALTHLTRMRQDEGANLAADLTQRLAVIEQEAARVDELMQETRTARVVALREKVQALVGEMGLEETRLYQEIVKLVDRQDTSEETSRIRSHVALARSLVEKGEGVGKRLDFLAQELTREANTIGSKAASTAVVQLVVGLKAEIEKLREQVQNVE
jgi:uncharacterized protein (TIGR00255 family)